MLLIELELQVKFDIISLVVLNEVSQLAGSSLGLSCGKPVA